MAYAVSFRDPHFNEEFYQILNEGPANFKALGLREHQMLRYVAAYTFISVQKALDAALFLDVSDYDNITEKRIESEKYLLLYAQRYNPAMTEFVEKIAKENGWNCLVCPTGCCGMEQRHFTIR